MLAVNCLLPLCDSCQDTGIIIDRPTSFESALSLAAVAQTSALQPLGFLVTSYQGGGGYLGKQEPNLHIIIMSACKDGLLNYIPFKTLNDKELRSTNYCSSINFNCCWLFFSSYRALAVRLFNSLLNTSETDCFPLPETCLSLFDYLPP